MEGTVSIEGYSIACVYIYISHVYIQYIYIIIIILYILMYIEYSYSIYIHVWKVGPPVISLPISPNNDTIIVVSRISPVICTNLAI